MMIVQRDEGRRWGANCSPFSCVFVRPPYIEMVFICMYVLNYRELHGALRVVCRS